MQTYVLYQWKILLRKNYSLFSWLRAFENFWSSISSRKSRNGLTCLFKRSIADGIVNKSGFSESHTSSYFKGQLVNTALQIEQFRFDLGLI
ncbi:hypothetical protein [Psychrobacillus sp. L3]|uniref:hypothetical protein n=1 Tax=Psychrobacillus sp. L3 TaxID=3236891 RepID=UPI0036F3DE0A